MTRRPPLWPGVVSLAGAQVITEGDGRPVLYLAAYTPGARVKVCRVPPDCRVLLEVPQPLPTAKEEARGFPMRGSRALFQTDRAASPLALNTAGVARELLEALTALEHATESARAARRVFEGESA